MKLWEKNNKLNTKVEKFTVGNDYILDKKLVKYDCYASIAHAKMLYKIKILKEKEYKEIKEELEKIISIDKKGLFQINTGDEDCHTAIENHLIKKLGDTGKKIHTARSRNDQVLTALRLYYKDEIKKITDLIQDFINSILRLKTKYGHINLPGYTHMRKAMPSSIALWCDAFIESMQDNIELISFIHKHINKSPLGTGAGYGLPIKIDRNITKNILDFGKLQKNSLYVQNSRGKFESLILEGLSHILLDLNKISSDIILFSMAEFGFMELSNEICTGSSIMPHKKNPDVLELTRANYNKLICLEFEIKGIIGNLISGYHRDFQLTKEPIINGFTLTKESLEIMKVVFEHLIINSGKCKEAMSKDLFETMKVYDLVEKGFPFRDAYMHISI